MIKNHTPYIGKIFLAWEKDPEYQNHTILNKVHLNLGFTKLVSRMEPIDDTYDHCKNWRVDRDKVMLIEEYTGGNIGAHKFDGGILQNAFLHPDGRYIGDIRTGWRYFKNNWGITDKKPNTVAVVFNEYSYSKGHTGINTDNVKGYLGYSHRGAQLFRIGDRLFDGMWTGGNSPQQLEKMPYNCRGEKVIETLEEAEQAAINISKYL